MIADIQKSQMENLIAKLNYYTKLYDAGTPAISDKEWDDMYFELVKLEEETDFRMYGSPTQKIHFETVSALEKVKHDHPMMSLNKTKDINEIESFIKNHDSCFMLKMDGLTCSLTYENGRLIKAETRGDGETGEDILHNARVIKNIPKVINFKEKLVVDGEVICDYESFKNFSEEYANPRNFAAGSIRLLDSRESASRKLSFVAWDVIEGINKDGLSDKLIAIEQLGFTIVPMLQPDNNYTAEENIDFLKKEAEYYHYPIDGIVIKWDNCENYKDAGLTGHHPKGALAFKFYDEEYDSQLIDIEWSMGRTGQLTPVAIYEDIDTGESILNRASLHNVSVLNETLGMPFKGQKIKVYKANQIIPQISWAEKWTVDKPFLMNPIACPVCGGPVTYKKNGDVETVWCENNECEGQLINKIEHFVSKKGLDIKGLSKATIEKLMDWGWLNSIKDVFTLSTFAREWKNKPGFGEKSVDNIITAIERAKHCTLEAVIAGAGIPFIGRTIAKDIAKRLGTYDSFRKAIYDPDFKFSNWDGYGYEINKALKKFDYDELDYIVNEFLTIEEVKDAGPAADTVKDLIFCITGKLSKARDLIKKDIEAAGGKVGSSVTGKTNYLVCNDKNSTTGKSADAKKLNVPVISEEELMELLK